MTTNNEADNLPWWRKAIARGIGILAAIVMFICGIVTCTAIFSPLCVAAGVFMIIIAFIMMLFEAPICCKCIEATKPLSEWIERRRYWHKGVVYILISIIPIAMCQGASVIVGFVFAVLVGLVYIFMSWRKQDPEFSNAGGVAGGRDDFIGP